MRSALAINRLGLLNAEFLSTELSCNARTGDEIRGVMGNRCRGSRKFLQVCKN
jgi:hypothetical protein